MLSIKKFCSLNSIKHIENFNFGIKHGYKVNGIVSHYLETDSIDKLCHFLYFAKNNKLKVIGIASGSNVLINNKIDAVFVKYTSNSIRIEKENKAERIKVFRADANLSKKKLNDFCISNSLSNLEFLSGIPGTVSGALAMNAGAYGHETADFVLDINFASPDGIRKYTKRELDWSYRNLSILPYHIITSCSFLTRFNEEKDFIKNSCEYYINDRKKKHPLYFSSCGSVFKNPTNKLAWSLIKACDLSKKNYNGAKLSLLHSNFIVNNGSKNTSSNDIINLIRDIKLEVYKKFNINLEEEIKILC